MMQRLLDFRCQFMSHRRDKKKRGEEKIKKLCLLIKCMHAGGMSTQVCQTDAYFHEINPEICLNEARPKQ